MARLSLVNCFCVVLMYFLTVIFQRQAHPCHLMKLNCATTLELNNGICTTTDEENRCWKKICSSEYDPDDFGSTLTQTIYESIKEADFKLANPADYPDHYSPKCGEEFDFIVVGAGSAGAVIANRLSEVSDWSILLLEAGGDPTKSSEIPGIYGALQSTKIDWQYKTDPDEGNCLGMVNKSCKWPRGKVLGGSSTINANLYVRGSPIDFDSWAAAGNDGWDFNNVIKYFKKSEGIKAKEIISHPNYRHYHGEDGYLNVDSWRNYKIEDVVESYTKGMEELGYNFNNDCNSDSQMGFVRLQGTLKEGKRCSSAKAFLSPIKDRRNLKLSKHSLATQLLINKQSKTANGVKFLDKQGKLVHVKARKEIVVSAGAINSPQLLMLSGIGPKHHLEDFKIEVIQDLPVGENLQDHMLMTGLLISLNYTRDIKPFTQHMYDFLITNSSKLSGLGMLSYGAFINTLNSSSNLPDIQFHHFDFDPADTFSLDTYIKSFGLREDIGKLYHEINLKRFILLMMPTLLRPVSRGKVLLASTRPLDKPKIVSGYFSSSDDLETLLRAIDFTSKLASTAGMKRLDARFHEILVPDCLHHPLGSKDFRVCSLKHLTTTTYHPTSTCKMGPTNDSTSVVDPTLKVIGIRNLRVADASIMPTIVSGNTNAAAIMIGEKVSDIIKEAWV